MDNKKVGGFIAKLRREKGLTQSALAEKLNISNKAVSKWENGDSMPDISLLPELSGTLGVSVDELLMGEKGEETKIKVEEVANEKNLLNIFNICFAVAAFCCAFGALLGGFCEIYSDFNFRILFYNHWEIIFAAVSFFAIVLGNLIFYIAVIRLGVIFDKKQILALAYKKAITLAFFSYIFIALFLIRIIDRSYVPVLFMFIFGFITFFVILLCYGVKKLIDKRLDNNGEKK